MKILRIAFKNINNLKGEHTIDFESAPLAHAGIFAIVGPTGSGKSTLLDVITLALFNQIPRFKRAISKSEIGSLGSVMTFHTNEASASITYQIRNTKYTSVWSISKTRTGNLKDYQMFLYDSTGTPYDLKKSEVPARNEEIIGLKYDQFIKSIILSQGEFARFIKADKKDRVKLLENITGTYLYRKLGNTCYRKHDELKKKLEKQKEIHGVITVLSDDEKEIRIKNLDKLINDKYLIDKKVKSLNSLKETKELIRRSTIALEEKKLASIEVVKKIAEYAPQIGKLKIHELINPLRGDIADYTTATKNADLSAKNLDHYKATSKIGQEQLKAAISEMSALTKEKVDTENFMSVMSKFEKKVNDLDKDISHLKDRGLEERKLINEQKVNYSLEIDDKASPENAITVLTDHATTLKKKIKFANLSSSANTQKVKQEITLLRDQCTMLRDLSHNFEHVAEEEKKIVLEKNKVEESEKLISEKTPLLHKDEETLEAISKNIELLNKRKEDQIKIAKLEDLRHQLNDGDPCPLCGATDHPYTKHLDKETESKIEIEISKTKVQLDKKKIEVDHLRNLIVGAKTKSKISKERIAELLLNLKEGKKASTEMINMYQGKEKITGENIAEIYQSNKAHLEQKEQALQSLDALQLNQELIKSYGRLKSIGQSFKEKYEKRKSLFEGEDINAITNPLQNKYTDANSKLLESKTSIAKETEDLAGAKKMLASLESKLLPRAKKLGFQSISELTSNILSEEEAIKIRTEQDSLKQFETKTNTEISVLQNQIKAAKEKDSQINLALEDLLLSIVAEEQTQNDLTSKISEIKTILKRDDEDKQKLKSREKEIESLTKELERWSLLNNLIGDATGNKFANFSQGLTLQNLLVYTNKRLKHLSDRYLIKKPESEGALRVIDQYQGNIVRAVSTLSGGETFLISLALALSLSDMASKNVSLECLFIDEGFGTLDQETLEVAMMTLEKLQTESQKTVGVISHVEALKERIKVQIQLEKSAQGYSKIRIEA